MCILKWEVRSLSDLMLWLQRGLMCHLLVWKISLTSLFLMCSHRRWWVGSHSQTFKIYFPSVADLCEPGGWHWLYKVLTKEPPKPLWLWKSDPILQIPEELPMVVTPIQLFWASAVCIREVCLDTILFAHPIFPKIQNMLFIDIILVCHQCSPVSFSIISLHPQNGSGSLLKYLLKKGCQISLK